jgi:SHS2 domain-containing protein
MDTLTTNYTPLLILFNRTLGYTDRVPSSGFVDLDHTADWAIRVQGADLPDLCVQAAAGMLSLANPSPLPSRLGVHRQVRVRAADRESLLVRWLEELHFMLEAQGQVPRRIQLNISPDLVLVADLVVGPVEVPGRAIKAVTFHGLQVKETASGLEATVVFDV